jgi:hypothetical protein
MNTSACPYSHKDCCNKVEAELREEEIQNLFRDHDLNMDKDMRRINRLRTKIKRLEATIENLRQPTKVHK